MRSQKRLLSRWSSIAFGALFLTLIYACTDRAIAPTATDTASEFALSGILSSSLWRVNSAGPSYAGSVSAQARLTQDKNGVHQDIGPATISDELFASPSSPANRFGAVLLPAPLFDKRDGGDVKWRAQFKSPRLKLKTSNGKDVTIQTVPDPRGDGRPPVASMLFDGDRPVSMIQSIYERDGKRWRPTRSRVTVFGNDGKPGAVVESDLTALQTAGAALPGTAAVLAEGFRRVGGSLSKLVRPDALFAATVDDALSKCFIEGVYVAAAAAAQVAADIALGIAIAACVGVPLSCPAVVAAMLTVSATAAVYLLRIIAWEECMNPPRIVTGGGGGGSGGSGGSGGVAGCFAIVWEISYDGGATWSYLDTTFQCV